MRVRRVCEKPVGWERRAEVFCGSAVVVQIQGVDIAERLRAEAEWDER